MNQLRWYGENDTLEVGPFKIKGPMVYGAPSNYWDEPSAINTSLPIRRPESEADLFGDKDVYTVYEWAYEELEPAWRWEYLEWLSQGRPQTTNLLFLTLFVQGLERRLIIDQSEPEPIWDELWRLSPDTYGGYSFIHNTIERLLWCLLFPVGKHAQNSQVARLARMEGQSHRRDEDAALRLMMLVSWGIIHFGRLPEWLAFYCALSLSPTKPGVTFERAEAEMLQLFVAQAKQWKEAKLQLPLSTKYLCSWEYEPLNETVPGVVLHWPDPFEQQRQWRQLSKDLVTLFEQCQIALRPFATVLGKEGVTRESRLAWEALPAELRQGEHPSRARLLQLGGELLEQTGYATTTVGHIAGALEMSQRPALTMSLSKEMVQSLQFCGMGIEPDVHLTGKPYRWDEPLVLFTTIEETYGLFVQDVSVRYQSYSTFIRYALFVAQAAGEVRQETLSLIAGRLSEAFKLQPLEMRRARALVNLLVRQEIDLKGFRSPQQGQDKLREHLPPLLLKIVGMNGQVNTAEEVALATIWKGLGLEKRNLTQQLDALSARGVVFVGDTVSGCPGEKLPPSPPDSSVIMAFELDHAVIGELLEDTAHVHRALSEAMAVDEGSSQNAEGGSGELVVQKTPVPAESDVVIQDPSANGLPPQLNALLTALLQQAQWEKEAAGELARRHGTMLAGAIEKINEWAFEELGEQLIYDDGDVLSMERELMGDCGF